MCCCTRFITVDPQRRIRRKPCWPNKNNLFSIRQFSIRCDLASFCRFLCPFFVVCLPLLPAHVFAFLGSFLALLFLLSFPLCFDAFFPLFFSLLYLFPNGRIKLCAGFLAADLDPKARHCPYASTIGTTLRNGIRGCTILYVMRLELMAAIGAVECG